MTDKIIIGLVGETGAGKDLFCELARKINKNTFSFRFSDPLKEILRIVSDNIRKSDQQWLAIVLREHFGEDVLGNVLLKKIKNIKNGLIIFNGIRSLAESLFVKKLGGLPAGRQGKIVYITADSKTRWQRVKARAEKKDDALPYRNFLRLEKAKTEVLIPKIGAKADFKIINNGSKEDFSGEVAKIIKIVYDNGRS